MDLGSRGSNVDGLPLARCTGRLPDPLRTKVFATADKYEQKFLSVATVDSNCPMERFTDSELHSAPWWRYRIPDREPAFAESAKWWNTRLGFRSAA